MIKQLIFYALLIISALSIEVFTIHEGWYVNYEYNRYCTVIKKNDYIETTKHKSNYQSHPNRSLIVKWKDDGSLSEVGVSVNMFYSTNVGDFTGFVERHPDFQQTHRVTSLIFVIITFVSVVVELFLLGFVIYWLIAKYVFDVEEP